MWVNRKAFEQLQKETENLLAQLEQVKKQAVLVSIERSGRMNHFTFVRDGKVVEVQTMGLISDDLPAWKEKLLR